MHVVSTPRPSLGKIHSSNMLAYFYEPFSLGSYKFFKKKFDLLHFNNVSMSVYTSYAYHLFQKHTEAINHLLNA